MKQSPQKTEQSGLGFIRIVRILNHRCVIWAMDHKLPGWTGHIPASTVALTLLTGMMDFQFVNTIVAIVAVVIARLFYAFSISDFRGLRGFIYAWISAAVALPLTMFLTILVFFPPILLAIIIVSVIVRWLYAFTMDSNHQRTDDDQNSDLRSLPLSGRGKSEQPQQKSEQPQQTSEQSQQKSEQLQQKTEQSEFKWLRGFLYVIGVICTALAAVDFSRDDYYDSDNPCSPHYTDFHDDN